MELSSETLQIWSKRLSLLTAVIVGLLSWWGSVTLVRLVLRMCLSFGVIYGLTSVSLILFRAGAKKPEPENNDLKGWLVDISVGEGELKENMAGIPGQVERLAAGLTDSEKQAEIVRSMGWS